MAAPMRARKLIVALNGMEIGYNIGAIASEAVAQGRATSDDS
jgi:hypothetical protein